jgi:hypothetical protein
LHLPIKVIHASGSEQRDSVSRNACLGQIVHGALGSRSGFEDSTDCFHNSPRLSLFKATGQLRLRTDTPESGCQYYYYAGHTESHGSDAKNCGRNHLENWQDQFSCP